MSKTRELYLLWSPQGWGIFNEVNCPDSHGLPQYWFKKYEVPCDEEREVFNKLMDAMVQLVKKNIIPDEENYSRIFPDISNILE